MKLKRKKNEEINENEEIKDEIDEETEEQNAEKSESEEKENSEEGPSEIEKLEKELEEKTTRVLRLQADFDNYRKRVEKEKADIVKFASAGVIEKLLPVLDNFDRALSEENKKEVKDQGFFEGVEMIKKQLLDTLESEGLKEIDAFEKQFDPNYHNAVQQVESEDHESNTVVEVYQKGYQVKEKVIRPSMVVVSK